MCLCENNKTASLQTNSTNYHRILIALASAKEEKEKKKKPQQYKNTNFDKLRIHFKRVSCDYTKRRKTSFRHNQNAWNENTRQDKTHAFHTRRN